MTTPRLNVLPSDYPAPLKTKMPLKGARRWVSPDEELGFTPLTRVFVAQDAYCRVMEHTASDMENEVGGVLVGNWSVNRGTKQQFIVVEFALPARFTRQSSATLTFTQDSLVHINTEMDDRFPDKQIVGWYHTHPGMGIFLSQYDTWLHQHFFPESWQVALVFEPRSSTGGFFIRQPGGTLDPDRYFGFYEIEGTSGISIVRWNNLRSDEAIDPEGEKINE
jgi:proteasome lid subunit RPN8/RPN11